LSRSETAPVAGGSIRSLLCFWEVNCSVVSRCLDGSCGYVISLSIMMAVGGVGVEVSWCWGRQTEVGLCLALCGLDDLLHPREPSVWLL